MEINKMETKQLIQLLSKLTTLRKMSDFDREMYKHYSNKINYVKRCIKHNAWRSIERNG